MGIRNKHARKRGGVITRIGFNSWNSWLDLTVETVDS